MSHQLADATQANDAQCFACEFDTFPLRALPATTHECGVGLRHVASHRHQQRDRVLGSRNDVRFRRVGHHDTGFCCSVDINVVQTNASTTHNEQTAHSAEHRGVNVGSTTHDERLRTLQCSNERFAIQPELHIDHMASSTQAVKTRIGDFFGDKDSSHTSIVAGHGHHHQLPHHTATRLPDAHVPISASLHRYREGNSLLTTSKVSLVYFSLAKDPACHISFFHPSGWMLHEPFAKSTETKPRRLPSSFVSTLSPPTCRSAMALSTATWIPPAAKWSWTSGTSTPLMQHSLPTM